MLIRMNGMTKRIFGELAEEHGASVVMMCGSTIEEYDNEVTLTSKYNY